MTKIKANQLEIREILNDPTAQASETWKGTLRIATQAEVNAGSPAYDNITVVTPRTLAGSNFNTNWLIANNNSDFGTAPTSLGTDSIALGFNARTGTHNEALAIGHQASSNGARGITLGWTSSSTLDSISIGGSIQGNHTKNILIGSNILSAQSYQIAIGAQHKSSYAPTPDVPYSTKIGHAHPTNKNVMHQHSKGKLELLGDEAQFIMPNYSPTGSPATALPSTTNQGGTIYDFDTKTLKFYNGTAWTELNANNWLSANGGDNFAIAPTALFSNAIALGQNSQALASNALAVGTNVSASVDSVSLGVNSDTLGSSSIAIGSLAQSGDVGEGATIAIGLSSSAVKAFQISIGRGVVATSSVTDVQYSTKIGYGTADTNKNMLHLFSKGKLELYGESAQFIMPNYAAGSPSVLPSTATEGGVIYDSTLQGLKLYDGATWQDVGGGGGGSAGGLDTEIQYNNGGAFGGIAEFTYNDGTGALEMVATGIGSNDRVLYVDNITGGVFSYAIDAKASGTSTQVAIRGTSTATTGRGLEGVFTGSGAGQAIKAFTSTDVGTGLFAECNAATGISTAVHGKVASVSGRAGFFENTDGTDTEIVLASATDLIIGSVDGTEKFSIDDTGEANFVGNVISHIAINAQTGLDYTLVLADDGKLVTMSNASPNDLIIPANASVAFPIGTQILVEQEGTGTTTIVSAGSPPDVTINSAGGFFDTASQYTTISLIKKATDTWLIVGDLV